MGCRAGCGPACHAHTLPPPDGPGQWPPADPRLPRAVPSRYSRPVLRVTRRQGDGLAKKCLAPRGGGRRCVRCNRRRSRAAVPPVPPWPPVPRPGSGLRPAPAAPFSSWRPPPAPCGRSACFPENPRRWPPRPTKRGCTWPAALAPAGSGQSALRREKWCARHESGIRRRRWWCRQMARRCMSATGSLAACVCFMPPTAARGRSSRCRASRSPAR